MGKLVRETFIAIELFVGTLTVVYLEIYIADQQSYDLQKKFHSFVKNCETYKISFPKVCHIWCMILLKDVTYMLVINLYVQSASQASNML